LPAERWFSCLPNAGSLACRRALKAA